MKRLLVSVCLAGASLAVLSALGVSPQASGQEVLFPNTSAGQPEELDTAAVSWLEPRAINIVELIGQVPESYLHGMIISYRDWDGIVVYDAGTRVGNTVVVTTTMYTRWDKGNTRTTFGCLGQSPHFDHIGSIVPESYLRVYTLGGTDVTEDIYHMELTDVGLLQPSAGSGATYRYPNVLYGDWVPGSPLPPMTPAGLTIPTNSGCKLLIDDTNYYSLTGVFTLELNPSISISVLDTQTVTFQSYIGVGNVGIFQPLMAQLQGTYGWRHDRVPLSIPQNTDYFLVKYPPMPAEPYADTFYGGPDYPNADRFASGTYRMSRGYLSTDLVFSGAFPMYAVWRDSDQSSGSTFLPLLGDPSHLAPLEYVIPAGIPYNSCFTQGNCSGSVLQQIYDAEMELEIIYLSVNRPAGLQRIPLRMAGPGFPRWAPPAIVLGTSPSDDLAPHTNELRASNTMTYYTYLPLVLVFEEDDPTGCPCGLFDGIGRMLDYIPPP